MQLRLGLTLALSVVSLAGCSSLAVNNGSLDYKETATLEPLKYPEGSMVRPATPLYPAPTVEAPSSCSSHVECRINGNS